MIDIVHRIKACDFDFNLEQKVNKKSTDDEESDKTFPGDGMENAMGETGNKSSKKVHRTKPCHDDENLTEKVDKIKQANDNGESDLTSPKDGRKEATLERE